MRGWKPSELANGCRKTNHVSPSALTPLCPSFVLSSRRLPASSAMIGDFRLATESPTKIDEVEAASTETASTSEAPMTVKRALHELPQELGLQSLGR